MLNKRKHTERIEEMFPPQAQPHRTRNQPQAHFELIPQLRKEEFCSALNRRRGHGMVSGKSIKIERRKAWRRNISEILENGGRKFI